MGIMTSQSSLLLYGSTFDESNLGTLKLFFFFLTFVNSVWPLFSSPFRLSWKSLVCDSLILALGALRWLSHALVLTPILICGPGGLLGLLLAVTVVVEGFFSVYTRGKP